MVYEKFYRTGLQIKSVGLSLQPLLKEFQKNTPTQSPIPSKMVRSSRG